jgi:hypothetical protein
MGERTESAVAVPIAQSVTSGLITGSIGAVVASFAPDTPWARIGVLTGLVTTGLVWVWSVRDDAQRVWYRLEKTLGVDLDGDGIVGEPAKARAAWVKQAEHKAYWKRYVIPFADYEEAHSVARAVLARNVPFTRRALVLARALPDDPEHYSEIYQAMVNAHLLDKDSVTTMGRRYLADCMYPTPPTGE